MAKLRKMFYQHNTSLLKRAITPIEITMPIIRYRGTDRIRKEMLMFASEDHIEKMHIYRNRVNRELLSVHSLFDSGIMPDGTRKGIRETEYALEDAWKADKIDDMIAIMSRSFIGDYKSSTDFQRMKHTHSELTIEHEAPIVPYHHFMTVTNPINIDFDTVIIPYTGDGSMIAGDIGDFLYVCFQCMKATYKLVNVKLVEIDT